MATKTANALKAKLDATKLTATAATTATVEIVEGGILSYKPTAEVAKALTVYVKARTKKAEAEAAMKAAAEVIKADIDAYEAATGEAVEEFTAKSRHVIYREVKATKLNTSDVKKKYPAVFEALSYTATTRPLKIN